MLVPRIFGKPVLDDFFESPFAEYKKSSLMSTDVKETDDAYEVNMDLPGVAKEDVSVEFSDGYINVKASRNYENNDEAEDGTYIHRERYSGSASRSFYVGDSVKKEDIKAKFDNGILKIDVPKKEQKKLEKSNFIEIE